MEETFFWTSHDFLEKILQKSKNDTSLSICSSSVENAFGKGDNYISKLFRVVVKSGDPDEKNSFFVKVLPDEGIVRDMIVKSTAFSYEMKMYRETLPKMKKMLGRASPSECRKLVPECYYLSGAEEPSVLIIEDLTERGYAIADRRKGLDLDHCMLVMKTIARFHACSAAVRAEDPPAVEGYMTNLFFEDSCHTFWMNNLRTTLNAVAEVVRRWDDFGEGFADRLRARAETMRGDLVKLVNGDDEFKVLVHGDLWVNNVLFRYVGGVPLDAALIDFQFCFLASPAVDLQQFVHTSPTEEVRVNHIYDLLRGYHEELCYTLRVLGRGHQAITFQRLLEEYESKALVGVFATLLCLPVVLCDPKDACDFEGLLKNEVDTDAVLRRVLNHEYSRALRRLLRQFHAKGLI